MLSLVSLYQYKFLRCKVIAVAVITHVNVSRIVLNERYVFVQFFFFCESVKPIKM